MSGECVERGRVREIAQLRSEVMERQARWRNGRLRGAGAHTLDEHIEVDSLVERARLMAGLLATLD